MDFPEKVQKWLDKKVFPQRLLLSGAGDNLELTLELAAQLQEVSRTQIEKGIHADTKVFRDEGENFKIGEDGEDQNSIRGMIKWCSQKPTANWRMIILENIERASHGSFHAVLKLVEEPPPRAIIIFTTQNHHQLLDTILSRMTIVRLAKSPDDSEISDEIQHFLESSDLIAKFQKIDQLVQQSKEAKDKTIVLDFLQQLIVYARIFDKHRPSLDLLHETHRGFKQNINQKLLLERLALEITK